MRSVGKSDFDSFYGTDLAYVHDRAFGGYCRQAVPGLLSALAMHGISEGTVVDLGCGSGVWLAALKQNGYTPVGIDLSPEMIRLARLRVDGAKLVEGSVFEAEMPSCRAITSVGEALNYCREGQEWESDLAALFVNAYGSLESGGLFVFDFRRPARTKARRQRRVDVSGDDWFLAAEIEEEPEGRRLTRRIVCSRKVRSEWRETKEVHLQRFLPAGRVLSMLRETGFRSRVVRSIGEWVLDEEHFGFIARKEGA